MLFCLPATVPVTVTVEPAEAVPELITRVAAREAVAVAVGENAKVAPLGNPLTSSEAVGSHCPKAEIEIVAGAEGFPCTAVIVLGPLSVKSTTRTVESCECARPLASLAEIFAV